MQLLAYGGFRSTEYWPMFFEVLPIFLQGAAIATIPYVFCSFMMRSYKKFRYFWLLLYLGCLPFIFPSFNCMGAFGPPHVANGISALATWLYFLVLVIQWVYFIRKCKYEE